MSTALVHAPTTGADIFTADGFATTMKICEALVKSGILPRGVDTPFKAFAIVQKGREIGVGPMRALTGIHLIEGKPVVSPELKLEQFRERGGRVKWVRSDNTVAELWLKAPNGDEHTETVTIEDMKTAGVAGKDNWRKYPKSMLRARCVGFGLRALGEGDGSYTPDELGAVTDEDGNVQYTPPERAEDTRARAEYVQAARNGSPGAAAPNAAQTPAAPPAPSPPLGDVAGPKGAAPSSTTAQASALSTPSTAGTAASNGSRRRDSGAKDIKHDGNSCSSGQVMKLHVLRAKIPSLNATPDDPRSKWRQTIQVYRRADGTRCEHSNELSVAQARHLIDRMQAKVDELVAKEREIREGEPTAVGDLVERFNETHHLAPADLLEKLHAVFVSASEELEWLNALGFADPDSIPEESRLIVCQLAAAWGAMLKDQAMAPTFKELLGKARALGHISPTGQHNVESLALSVMSVRL